MVVNMGRPIHLYKDFDQIKRFSEVGEIYMNAHKRISKVYESLPLLYLFNDNSRIVIMSDCHR